MLTNRDLMDLGYFLISPEDSRAEEHRRMLTNRHVCPDTERAGESLRRTVRTMANSRAAGACKTFLWMAVSMALGLGIGQLH